ncbi:MAG: ABC transporter ATP-binding protein, partial [Phycisphaeraceae bacterium]
MSLWVLQNVSVQGSPRARLSDVTLTIQPGVTAVLGESGAGKTTLLNLLVGFEKAGRGTVQEELGEEPLSMYWSPSDGGLWPHLSVREHLLAVMPLKDGRGCEGASAAGDVGELLDSFALGDLAEAKPARLSMGERSRLSVARALASGAKALVMDEPLANVDSARLPQFWNAIREYLQRTGGSLVFATHSADTVLAEASHVICLREGRVIYAGDVQTLYRNPPTLDAARCLGEVNWLTPVEANLWLPPTQDSGPRTQDSALRPEHLSLDIDSAAPLVVQSSRFRGMLTDVTLQHSPSNSTRTFVCRSPAGDQGAAKAGDRGRRGRPAEDQRVDALCDR